MKKPAVKYQLMNYYEIKMNTIFYKNQLLVELDHEILKLPTTNKIVNAKIPLVEIHSNSNGLLAELIDNTIIDSNLKLISIRQALNYFNDSTIKHISLNYQLYNYYFSHKFCGLCGSITNKQKINKFMFCMNCNTEVYPHIAPCIIVRVHKENQILMARGIDFPASVWGLIAGFVEIGESLEEAVIREVKEEVGICISNIKYWGSQAWPFPSNSLMVGFTAQYVAGDIVVEPNEIEQAGFYSIDTIPGEPSSSFSIASKMIAEFKNKK